MKLNNTNKGILFQTFNCKRKVETRRINARCRWNANHFCSKNYTVRCYTLGVIGLMRSFYWYVYYHVRYQKKYIFALLCMHFFKLLRSIRLWEPQCPSAVLMPATQSAIWNEMKLKFIGSISTTKTCQITSHKKWKIIIKRRITY